jgi:hypothetical protein
VPNFLDLRLELVNRYYWEVEEVRWVAKVDMLSAIWPVQL